jgi:hypothetical protein
VCSKEQKYLYEIGIIKNNCTRAKNLFYLFIGWEQQKNVGGTKFKFMLLAVFL